jgi:hypothetical protein
LLAEVEFLRIRQATGLNTLAAQATTPKAKKDGKKGGSEQPNPERPATWPTNRNPEMPV